tara:strand:+ start:1330 stop:2040 length:711 start_codon:yes stop_codon:yes gene_type:complete
MLIEYLEEVMRTLNEIMNAHGSDKGDGNWPNHNYAWLYDHWMANRRTDAVNLLEIGVTRTFRDGRSFPCASVLGWAEYFPNGSVVGYDLADWTGAVDNPRISFFKGDQGSPADLARFHSDYRLKRFDYIIDDGSHKTKDQVTSFVKLFPKLRFGGTYIIEDCSRETVEAFESLRAEGVLLPPPDCPVTLDECCFVSDACGVCIHCHLTGCAGRAKKYNHLIVAHRVIRTSVPPPTA